LGGSAAVAWRHGGRADVAAYLKRRAATFPAPRKLAISGSSAGGFGALLNCDAARQASTGDEAWSSRHP
jgi:hypothetical protein